MLELSELEGLPMKTSFRPEQPRPTSSHGIGLVGLRKRAEVCGGWLVRPLLRAQVCRTVRRAVCAAIPVCAGTRAGP